MNITSDCVDCIVGQIKKATNALECEKNLADEINTEVLRRSKSFSFSHTPPWVVRDVYELLSQKLDRDDPLETIKQDSIKAALKLIPIVEDKLSASKDKLFTAIKASVAGNVIDFAAKEQFNLSHEIQNVFDTQFSINDYSLLKEKLDHIDRLMILADNSGENVFDKVLLQTLKKLYPNIKLFYVTRGKPVINDITTKEAYQIGIQEFASIIDSGVDTPGYDRSRASTTFNELYDTMPLIISKGMGNFECLEGSKDKRIFFLFKVKCNVVSDAIDEKIGSIILKNG